ncbi:MerR family transcriptional regulator [Holophaga foetida]|uniref:MerR family transcriptional regulator n=1 Tax=Holophaga foetida TaxID=35839 RepID=UPI0002472AD6|nr:MerR family transcriptional regulator [Holophaga foetida]
MERLWFKIGETAARIGVKPKDLRYWEQVIPEIRPRRSHGNLRYYHRDDLPRLERIRSWLTEGLTVGDCRQLLLTGQLTRGFDFGIEPETDPEPQPPIPTHPKRLQSKQEPPPPSLHRPDLSSILESLRTLQNRLTQPPETAPRPKPELDAPPKGR